MRVWATLPSSREVLPRPPANPSADPARPPQLNRRNQTHRSRPRNWTTLSATPPRTKMPHAFRMRSTRPSACRPSTSPAQTHTRPSLCNRQPWRPSHRRNPRTAPSCPRPSCETACCQTRSSRPSSTRGRRMARISLGLGPSMRPETWSPLHRTMPLPPSASAGVSSSVMAPARARAASRLGSCSTTGAKAAARRSGSRRATSFWRTRSATGRRSGRSACW